MNGTRCPFAIRFSTTLVTRCFLNPGHGNVHIGRGLAEFPYQKVSWYAGDRREFETDRDDEHAWEDDSHAPTPDGEAA